MIFTIPVTTRVEDFDQHGRLTPTALLSIFENTAVRHAETVGYSPMDDSLRNGMAWLITNWRVAVERAPAYDEPFTASTWLCNNPRQATREMLLQSAGGEVLARGQAKLALVDRSCNKPCLPTPERLAAYQPELRTAFADKLPRLRPPAGCTAASPVQLRRSDMDYNGHLHNTAYLSLALDAAPPEVAAGGCTPSASLTAAPCAGATSPSSSPARRRAAGRPPSSAGTRSAPWWPSTNS